ncbi:MAG: FlgD immunoglobulin-like domain containing protein [Solirubrobacterales bacterium]
MRLGGRAGLGATLFFALLVASATVAVLVVRARTPDLVLEVTKQCTPPSPANNCTPEFDPRGKPRYRSLEIVFFVRESDPHALVRIVDSQEDTVRTLDADVGLDAGEKVTYVWDGRTDAGAVASPGRYRLGVELPGEDRDMIWPRRIFLGNVAGAP